MLTGNLAVSLTTSRITLPTTTIYTPSPKLLLAFVFLLTIFHTTYKTWEMTSLYIKTTKRECYTFILRCCDCNASFRFFSAKVKYGILTRECGTDQVELSGRGGTCLVQLPHFIKSVVSNSQPALHNTNPCPLKCTTLRQHFLIRSS